MKYLISDSNTKILVTAAAVAAAATIGWYTKYRQEKRKSIGTSTTANDRVVELNDFEQMAVGRGSAPITTLTWLERTAEDASTTQTEALLKLRVFDILRANPWLCGRFVKQANGKYAMEYSSSRITEADVDGILLFVEGSTSSFHLETPVDQLHKLCLKDKLILEFNKDREQPFWRVAVVPDCQEPGKRFAIVESFSHGAGDGHTFYALHNMLMGGEKVRALHVDRISNSTELAEKAMGEAETKIATSNLGFLFNMIRGVLLSKLIGPYLLRSAKYTAKSRYFLIDQKKIEKLKNDYKLRHSDDDTVPFVSTNDIVTSWYLANSKCENGLMAINLRGRLTGHTDNHGGNYENVIYYRLPQDAETPRLIRHSLASLQRTVTKDQPIQARQLLWQAFALCTNWATFVSPTLDMPGCERMIVHMPIYDFPETMPSTLSCCVLFQARPNQLAVVVSGLDSTMEGLSKAPFESDKDFSSILSSSPS